MRCGYCKRGGHSLYEDCDDGTVNIACPKSDHCDRNFDSVDHFQEFLDRRSRVESVCEELWELDDRLQPNEDYTITPNGQKLFKFVREAALNDGGIFETFCDLLKFYHEREGVYEHYDPRKVNELYDFIDQVMETPVMQRVYEELVELGIVQNEKTFRKQLWDLWFKFYGEQFRCAFKHIFCGEIEYKRNHGYTVGLHNWIRYYEQQREGHIEYLGWVGDEAPDKTANMVKIEFKWMGIPKKKSSMFIGTRPEFEMALYTLLYFIGDEGAPNNAMFGDHEVDIHIVRGIKGQQPGLLTVYPEEVEEDDDD